MKSEDKSRVERLKNKSSTEIHIVNAKYHKEDACGPQNMNYYDWMNYNACKDTDSLEDIIKKINRGSNCVSLRKDAWFLKHLKLYPEKSSYDGSHETELNRTVNVLNECKKLHEFRVNKDIVKLILENNKINKELAKLLIKQKK